MENKTTLLVWRYWQAGLAALQRHPQRGALTSQIEGTQATLDDLVDQEAGFAVRNTADVEEVTTYQRAFRLVQSQLREGAGRFGDCGRADRAEEEPELQLCRVHCTTQ